MSELQKPSLYVSRARHLSACLFHVSASGAIMVAATAYSRRLSQQNPCKTCVLLVELCRTSRHLTVHLEKSQQKSSPAGIGVVSFFVDFELWQIWCSKKCVGLFFLLSFSAKPRRPGPERGVAAYRRTPEREQTILIGWPLTLVRKFS